jgi:hypothetical protein
MPMVKALGGQRDSDGVVVPLIGVQHNAPEGKGPNFDHAGEAGKREGMTGVCPVQPPGKSLLAVAGEEPLVASPVKVRELQCALWAAAKQSSGRRFHALYDRICRGDVLWEAWERVRQNRGAAGVDRVTLVAVEDYGVDRMLRVLRRDLREGRGGLDFLGCHFRARMSGRLWAQKRIIRYYLHRWPSQTAMARVRAKVRERTGRNRGNYFRTGNAAIKFIQIDRYVVWRLARLLIRK